MSVPDGYHERLSESDLADVRRRLEAASLERVQTYPPERLRWLLHAARVLLGEVERLRSELRLDSKRANEFRAWVEELINDRHHELELLREREVDEQVRRGEVRTFESTQAFLDWLDEFVRQPDSEPKTEPARVEIDPRLRQLKVDQLLEIIERQANAIRILQTKAREREEDDVLAELVRDRIASASGQTMSGLEFIRSLGYDEIANELEREIAAREREASEPADGESGRPPDDPELPPE